MIKCFRSCGFIFFIWVQMLMNICVKLYSKAWQKSIFQRALCSRITIIEILCTGGQSHISNSAVAILISIFANYSNHWLLCTGESLLFSLGILILPIKQPYMYKHKLLTPDNSPYKSSVCIGFLVDCQGPHTQVTYGQINVYSLFSSR